MKASKKYPLEYSPLYNLRRKSKLASVLNTSNAIGNDIIALAKKNIGRRCVNNRIGYYTKSGIQLRSRSSSTVTER
jgi:hypothetical protein